MCVARVVRNEIEEHAQVAPLRFDDQPLHVGERSEVRMNVVVVGDVVAPVAVR